MLDSASVTVSTRYNILGFVTFFYYIFGSCYISSHCRKLGCYMPPNGEHFSGSVAGFADVNTVCDTEEKTDNL